MNDYDPLFRPFERRPDECSAVEVRYDNIDRIADYYASSGYKVQTDHDGSDKSITLRRDGQLDVTITIGKTLVYGHPPRVVNGEDFRREWRTAREQQ